MVSSQDSRSSDALRALERLGQMSLRDQSMDGLLQTVADLAKSVVSGAAESSVLLLIGDMPTTPVCTSPLALELDESQFEHDNGPCLHAARTGDVVEVTDATTEPRWRGYMDSAVEHGFLSSRALESRAVIDQAKGILMERHKLTADQAFQILARASMHSNVKVHAIAEHLVLTGEFLSR